MNEYVELPIMWWILLRVYIPSFIMIGFSYFIYRQFRNNFRGW